MYFGSEGYWKEVLLAMIPLSILFYITDGVGGFFGAITLGIMIIIASEKKYNENCRKRQEFIMKQISNNKNAKTFMEVFEEELVKYERGEKKL